MAEVQLEQDYKEMGLGVSWGEGQGDQIAGLGSLAEEHIGLPLKRAARAAGRRVGNRLSTGSSHEGALGPLEAVEVELVLLSLRKEYLGEA